MMKNNFVFERVKTPNFYDRKNSAVFTQLKCKVIFHHWYYLLRLILGANR